MCFALAFASAFWAYAENSATRRSETKLKGITTEIQQGHDRIALLKVEFAYLNRPDRIAALVNINFDDLKLIELTDTRFGDINQISLRAQPEPTLWPYALGATVQHGPV